MFYSLSAGDSFILDGRVVNDFANGEYLTLEFPNDSATSAKGKNGNGIVVFNEQGGVANLTLRVISGGETDKYLNNKYIQFRSDPTSYSFMDATITKYNGDGNGNLQKKIFSLTGGSVLRPAGTLISAEGNTDQAVAVYSLQFLNSNVSNN